MTLCSLNPRVRAFVAVSTLVAALLVTLPLAAWAQQDKPQAKHEQGRHYGPMSEEQIEKHIVRLHDQLQITAPQEAAWNDFAQVMRDNSKRMNTLIEKWTPTKGNRTAMENLKVHSEFTDEHAQALRKLVSAFEPLYNSMSPEQKKNADQVFEQEKGKKRHKGK